MPAGGRGNGPQTGRSGPANAAGGRGLAGSAALDLTRPDLTLGDLILGDLIQFDPARFDPVPFDPG